MKADRHFIQKEFEKAYDLYIQELNKTKFKKLLPYSESLANRRYAHLNIKSALCILSLGWEQEGRIIHHLSNAIFMYRYTSYKDIEYFSSQYGIAVSDRLYDCFIRAWIKTIASLIKHKQSVVAPFLFVRNNTGKISLEQRNAYALPIINVRYEKNKKGLFQLTLNIKTILEKWHFTHSDMSNCFTPSNSPIDKVKGDDLSHLLEDNYLQKRLKKLPVEYFYQILVAMGKDLHLRKMQYPFYRVVLQMQTKMPIAWFESDVLSRVILNRHQINQSSSHIAYDFQVNAEFDHISKKNQIMSKYYYEQRVNNDEIICNIEIID
jgi:hypothetical protein